jgi:hypothetical protein
LVILADVINGEDIRMIQRAGRLGFQLEAPQPIFISRKGSRQQFDGDNPGSAACHGL